MPGLVGLVTKRPRVDAERELSQMVSALAHESFYQTGTWIDEATGVYLGWALRTSSDRRALPIVDPHCDRVLAFSGDEYSSDADETGGTILARAAHAMSDLNGLFHGALLDRRSGELMLFSDRYGMHPLFYHEAKDAFYFAAETKAILAVRPSLRRVDPRALGEFVSCGCVLENRTLFDSIRALPGGEVWTFKNAALERRSTYFSPADWEQQEPLDQQLYVGELHDVLSNSLPRYFRGPERIGLAITGGLDTRLIMACRRPEPRSLTCYTYGSTYRDTQDVRVARIVSRLCGQSHTTLHAGEEFLSRFAHYAERTVYLTDGCLDVGRAADLFVSERARQLAPVKIVGTYGSEVLTTVPAFKPSSSQGGVFSALTRQVHEAEQTYHEARRAHPVTFAAFRQSPWWHHGILALEQSQLAVRSPFLDNDFVRTVYRAPVSAASSRDVRLQLIRDCNAKLAQVPTDRGASGSRSLWRALVRAAVTFSLKSEYAYDYGMPHWLASLDSRLRVLHLERLFLGRHKAFHFRVWYRDQLSRYVREMLLDSRTLSRPFLQRRAVEAVVSNHLSGAGNYTREIHKLLTLEIIHRQFVDAR